MPPPRARREIHFPPYRLDLDAGSLRSGNETIALRPKTWAVLCYLAARPGILVTKEQLLDAVWGGTAVTEATITKSIGEIRDALHDEVRRPRFVETVHRRGFRFVPALESAGVATQAQTPTSLARPVSVVAREADLSRLQAHLDAAASGARQTVFVTGEAGIGKTTLVEAFVASVAARSAEGACVVASGQCVRRLSGEEPLMPVLEAVGRLAREPTSARIVQLLRDHAPAWLIQLPWLVEASDLENLIARSTTTPERMLRLFAQVVEELTRDVTLVLVLEDLHWADASTVDLVSILAQRPEPARLLLLGTYRPADAIVSAGPFDAMRRSLSVKHRCQEVPLGPLSLSGVEAYLAARFGDHAPPAPLASLLHAQSDGNPLFLVTAVDYLTARGWLEHGEHGVVVKADFETLEQHVPGSLRELFEAHILGLEPFDVAVLEAASVAGIEFGAQIVAAALGVPVEQAEEACERLVRARRFLRANDTEAWPDGAVAARYAFAHAVYQRMLLHRIPAGRRRRLHRQIGERLEAGFATRAPDVAAELAGHFEHGGEPLRAVRWLESAAGAAARRFAPREAATYMRRALGLLAGQPDGPERKRRELDLTSALGTAVIATTGFAAGEAWVSLTRAHQLALEVGSPLEVFRIVYMLLNASQARADPIHSPRLTVDLARAAEQVATEEARLVAAMVSASAALWQGRCVEATGFAEVSAADPIAVGRFVPGENPVVWAHGAEGWRLWLLGYPDRALKYARAVVACARSQANPVNLPMGLALAAQVHLWRGDLEDADAAVEEGTKVASEHGFVLWRALLGSVAGGVQLRRGDPAAAVPHLEQSLGELRHIGVTVHVPALLIALAEASLRLGRVSEGLAAVEEGTKLVETTLCQWHAPEIWRLRGELLAAHGEPSEAVESSFARALEIARTQNARGYELRAATALARQLARNGRQPDARAALAPAFAAFSEGLDTADLLAARTLLAR